MRTRLSLVAILAIVTLACGETPPAAPGPAATPAAAAGLHGAPTAAPVQYVVTPAATPTAQPAAAPATTPAAQRGASPAVDAQSGGDSAPDSLSPEAQGARDQLGGGSALVGRIGFGLLTLEEAILESQTIARVSLLSTTSSVATVEESPAHVALLEFRFEVHEYLKGSGPNEIGALVGASYFTAADAEYAKALLAAAHDTRWDDRQAIVFLNYPEPGIQVPELGTGQYWLADVGGALSGYLDMYHCGEPLEQIVASGGAPDDRQVAVPSRARPGAGSVHARRARRHAAGRALGRGYDRDHHQPLRPEEPNHPPSRPRRTRGGTPGYRECVEYYYNFRREVAEFDKSNKSPRFTITSTTPSAPACQRGTVVYEPSLPSVAGTDRPGPKWIEGPDKDLMAYNVITVATSTEGWAEYRLQQVTARAAASRHLCLLPKRAVVAHRGVR